MIRDFINNRLRALRAFGMRSQEPEHQEQSIRAFAPHCDSRVLHAPGECIYCDRYRDWQEYRTIAGIAFTGKEPTKFQVPCPSDAKRGLGGAHVWIGNRPASWDQTAKDIRHSPYAGDRSRS